MSTITELERYKKCANQALIWAGKLAIACEMLFESNVFTLSENMEHVKKILSSYNKFIFDWKE